MRHGKKVLKLGRNASQRAAMLKNMCNDLFRHKRIMTTHAKARAVQRAAERLLNIAKRGDLAATRLLIRRLGKQHLVSSKKQLKEDPKLRFKTIVQELIDEIGPKISEMDEARKANNPKYTGGGYTRVLKLGRRDGDGAEMALIEILGYGEEYIETKKKVHLEKTEKAEKKKSLSERIKDKKEELQK